MLIKALNKKQIEKLAEIASVIGLVALASVIIPAIFEKFNLMVISVGFAISIIFWIISLVLLKGR